MVRTLGQFAGCLAAMGIAKTPRIEAGELPSWVTFPGEQWQRITAAEAGFDPGAFEELVAGQTVRGASFGGEAHGAGQFGAALCRGGYLVHSWGDPKYVYQTSSVGKAFSRAVVGLAVEAGLLDADDPVRRYWTGRGELSHAHKLLDADFHRTLTWSHLLQHRGGFPVSGGHNWRCNTGGGGYQPPEWAKCTGDPAYDNYAHIEPGQLVHYSSGGYWRLQQALTAVWGRDLKDVLDERLFSRIGIAAERWNWLSGEEVHRRKHFYPAMVGYGDFIDPPYTIGGHVVRGGGGWAEMCAEDLARFGLLIATGGVWNNEKLLDARWLTSHAGGNSSLVHGDSPTYCSLGVVTATGVPALDAFTDIIAGPVRASDPKPE